MLKVLGVHGVGNYRGDDVSQAGVELSKNWTNALLEGAPAGDPAHLDVAVAYYANLLHDGAAVGQSDPTLDSLDDEARACASAWARTFVAPPPAVAQGPATAWLRSALSWYANKRGLDAKNVERFVARFFGEVSRYLRPENAARSACVDVVADAIDALKPDVLIAHSLGSIVTYEALCARPVRVPLLITVGSPLAMPDVVFERLSPAPLGRVGADLHHVDRWVNVADIGDVVAVPRHLKKWFPEIDLDVETTINFWDLHLAKNYLASGPVAFEIFGKHDDEE